MRRLLVLFLASCAASVGGTGDCKLWAEEKAKKRIECGTPTEEAERLLRGEVEWCGGESPFAVLGPDVDECVTRLRAAKCDDIVSCR